MYDVLVAWESPAIAEGPPAYIRDYHEIWRAADKVVYSKTLEAVASERTRIERTFDPEAVRRLKAEADRGLSVGGPDLAAHAIRAGLVDELRLFVAPIVVGTGNPVLPSDARLRLHLLDESRFANGTIYLGYRVDANP
jgi:dihydrofolate reductase